MTLERQGESLMDENKDLSKHGNCLFTGQDKPEQKEEAQELDPEMHEL